MEVWRLSSKRLAALTFFAHRSLERPLPKKTRIIEPIRKHRIVCGEKHQRESWVREKKKTFYLSNFQKRKTGKISFLSMSSVTFVIFFKLRKVLYVIIEYKLLNHYLCIYQNKEEYLIA